MFTTQTKKQLSLLTLGAAIAAFSTFAQAQRGDLPGLSRNAASGLPAGAPGGTRVGAGISVRTARPDPPPWGGGGRKPTPSNPIDWGALFNPTKNPPIRLNPSPIDWGALIQAHRNPPRTYPPVHRYPGPSYPPVQAPAPYRNPPVVSRPGPVRTAPPANSIPTNPAPAVMSNNPRPSGNAVPSNAVPGNQPTNAVPGNSLPSNNKPKRNIVVDIGDPNPENHVPSNALPTFSGISKIEQPDDGKSVVYAPSYAAGGLIDYVVKDTVRTPSVYSGSTVIAAPKTPEYMRAPSGMPTVAPPLLHPHDPQTASMATGGHSASEEQESTEYIADKKVGLTAQPLIELLPDREKPLKWSAPGPDDRLVFYLGTIGCSDVTDGGWIEIGKDDFTMLYSVVVKYDDGSFRVWGDYLYLNWEVGDPWSESRSRIDNIMLAINLYPPTSEIEKEARVSGKAITSVHIATVMADNDPPDGYFRYKKVDDNGNFTRWLNLFDWSNYTGNDDTERMLSGKIRDYVSIMHSDADIIGANNHHFSRNDLERLFQYSKRADNADDVEAIVSNPVQLGLDWVWGDTFDTRGLPSIHQNVPSSFGGHGTGDFSQYDYGIHCLVGPQEAFRSYILPVRDLNSDEPFFDLIQARNADLWPDQIDFFWEE